MKYQEFTSEMINKGCNPSNTSQEAMVTAFIFFQKGISLDDCFNFAKGI